MGFWVVVEGGGGGGGGGIGMESKCGKVKCIRVLVDYEIAAVHAVGVTPLSTRPLSIATKIGINFISRRITEGKKKHFLFL